MHSFQQNRTHSFFALLSLPSTAMGFALSIQISALSWILTTQYNLDIHDVGLVCAAGPLAGIIGQVVIGVISDKVWFWNGRRRPFILIGGLLAKLRDSGFSNRRLEMLGESLQPGSSGTTCDTLHSESSTRWGRVCPASETTPHTSTRRWPKSSVRARATC